jgi:hypothetical protein
VNVSTIRTPATHGDPSRVLSSRRLPSNRVIFTTVPRLFRWNDTTANGVGADTRINAPERAGIALAARLVLLKDHIEKCRSAIILALVWETCCSGIACLVVLCAACGDPPATAPTSSSAAPSALIRLTGALNVGNVPIGTPGTGTFTITNIGTAPLTVSSLAYSSSDLVPAFSFNSGVIAAGAAQIVTVQITPANLQNYSGVVVVNSNASNSANAVPLMAVGIPIALWTQSGTGNATFDKPSYVAKITVDAGPTFYPAGGFGTSFLLIIGTGSGAQTLVQTGFSQEAIHTFFFGTVTITNSSTLMQVITSDLDSWTLTEVR